MKLNKIFIIFIMTLLFPITINTSWGICDVNIYDYSIIHSDKLVENIENTITSMNKKYGNIESRNFSIHIVNSIDDYKKYAMGYVPDWSVGITKSNPDRIVIKGPSLSRMSEENFYKTVNHELNHIYINRIKNKHTIPQWFKEGFASITANQFSLKHKITLSKNKWNNSLLSSNVLKRFKGVNSNNSFLAYSQSYAMIYGLQYYYGNEVIVKILEKLKSGNSFNESISNITGYNISYVNNQLLEFINNNYNWMIILDIPNMIFSVLPIILIFGFIYMKYNNFKKIKKWEEEEMIELNILEDEEQKEIN